MPSIKVQLVLKWMINLNRIGRPHGGKLFSSLTEKADIRSPFLPGSPIWPGIPLRPVKPIIPLSPGLPLGPVSPMSPFIPWKPGIPLNPFGPEVPILPLSPFGPIINSMKKIVTLKGLKFERNHHLQKVPSTVFKAQPTKENWES
uniref:Uncharacterized protein n=1 Tax=Callorhinchus milii TaxID=7868 RepID=A0A4W3IA56_CALMI